MIRKASKWLCGILVVLMLAVCVPAASAIEAAPETGARNVMVASVNTGAIIYEKNADQKIYPASTTKLMTMAVAIDLIPDLKATMTFDKKAAYADLVIGSSNMGLKDEEVIVLEDLMYGIAISSANEATNAIAIHLCGSIEAFVAKMNEKAAEWEMTNTHFANTHGLTDENHYTTPRDMMKLAQKVFADDRLHPFVSASSYRLPATNKNEARTIITTNQLIRMNSGNYYKYAVSGKTGSTTAAGFNLISTAKYKGMEYICLTMNAPYEVKPNPVFSDSVSLYKWAFNNFGMKTLMTESTSVCEIPAALSAKADHVLLSPSGKIEAVVADDTDVQNYAIHDLSAGISDEQRQKILAFMEAHPEVKISAVPDAYGAEEQGKEGAKAKEIAEAKAAAELMKSNLQAALSADPNVQYLWLTVTQGTAYAPVAVGDALGKVFLMETQSGAIYAEHGVVDLVATTELERTAILYYLHLIRTFFNNIVVRVVAIGLVLAIVAYIIFMIWQNNHRRRRKIARRIRF